jgi:glucosylceramidase
MIKTLTSNQDGLRWKVAETTRTKQPPTIQTDASIRFQTHLGFGGSITEAAAYTAKEGRSSAAFQNIIDLYFGNDGLRYNLTRIHMNSSDFSLGNYTYVDHFDKDLKSFNIQREELYVLPFLQAALSRVPLLKILISPWSPPGWMKDTGYMNHGGSLLPEYYSTWASYFVKFIKALQERNITPWGVSVQNEPAAKQTWDSCLYTPEQEHQFIKYHLGPQIKSAFNDAINILIWDHNRDIIMSRVAPILSDPEMKQFVWGTAFHWYGEEAFQNIQRVHDTFPKFHLLFTEGCIEGGPRPGAWDTGERYARNIIGDLNAFNEGFIDWNLVLNEQGGPNHVGNFCDAPLLWDRPRQTLIKNSSYYVIGHFSRYIEPGSIRIAIQGQLPSGVTGVAYERPNKSQVIVLLNSTEQSHAINVKLLKENVMVVLSKKSVTTVYMDEN